MTEKGYVVPDPADPEGLYCFRVYVPKHELYLAAFWGAYEFFATWLAWMRDPLKRGKVAARVWRAAVDLARQEFERTKGVCTMAIIGIRTNPLKPCVIQYQTDDLVWHDGPDLSCCGGGGGDGDCVPPLRVGPDGSVETTHDGGKTWEPTAPGTSQTDQQNYAPPYTGDPAAKCNSAVAYSENIKDTLEKILQGASIALTFGEYYLQIFGYLSYLFNYVFPIIELLRETLLGVYSASEVTNEARQGARDDVTFVCAFYSGFKADGSIDAAGIVKIQDALQALADAEADENKKWWYVHGKDLVNIFGVAGAQKGSTYPTSGELDCDNCPWEVTLDFTKSPHGFELFTRGTGANDGQKWVAGSGFQHGHTVTGAVMDALRVIPLTHITGFDQHIRVQRPAEATEGFAYNLSGAGTGLNPLAGVCDGTQQWFASGDFVHTCAFDVTAQGVYINTATQYTVYEDGQTWFTKLVIRGVGFNPFAGEDDA